MLSYLEVVEKVKHSCDEMEVISLIEEHKLEREQLLTDHLRSKQVSLSGLHGGIVFNLPHMTSLVASIGVASSAEGNAPPGAAQVLGEDDGEQNPRTRKSRHTGRV